MNSGMETNGAYFSPECTESQSTFNPYVHSDWSAYKINARSPAFENQPWDSRTANLLPPLAIECRPCPVFDMNLIMQPHMVPSNQYKYWDGYWKNYWQNYYRRADSFHGPRFDHRPQFEGDNRYFERDTPDRFERPHRYERFDYPDTQDRPHRRERPNRQDPPEQPERPNRAPESGRFNDILRAAKDSVGQQLFKFIPGTPGRLGCAASVSAALSKAGFNYAKHAGVGGLSEILQRNGWTKHEGIQNAQPGDVVVVARNARWAQGGGSAHIGIVGENGKVYHNSSGRQQWVEDNLQKVFGGGMMRFILRPPRA